MNQINVNKANNKFNNAHLNKTAELPQPKFLWFLISSYTMALVFANFFDPRIINIFGIITDAGTIVFPLTFLLSNLITEVYGYKHARYAIWLGFLFNSIFILYGQIVIHLPNPPYPTHNDLFTTIFALDIRIMIASSISYLCSEPFNSYVLAKLKIKTNGKLMPLRFVLSTFIASGIDSFIFGLLAFYGNIGNSDLLHLMLTMWLLKVAIEILGLPLSLRFAKKLKLKEKMDIYDFDTKFNLFNLEHKYTFKDNLLS